MASDQISPEMRLFSPAGERLYLTATERGRFLQAVDEEDSAERLYCLVLYYTGCRPSEALELTPARICRRRVYSFSLNQEMQTG